MAVGPEGSPARCTCSKSDSIFDVVMKVEGGLEFTAAKTRIARLLNRPDLVGEVSRGKPLQPMDAASLLQPPPQLRDDGLPLAYLARRLGVDVATVLRPTTPVAGWKALPYFDPARPGTKPKLKPVGGTLASSSARSPPMGGLTRIASMWLPWARARLTWAWGRMVGRVNRRNPRRSSRGAKLAAAPSYGATQTWRRA